MPVPSRSPSTLDGTPRYLAPGMPYVQVMVGKDAATGLPLDIQAIPNFLQGFKYTSKSDGGTAECEVTLFDPGFDYLERLVIAGRDDARFQFGWVRGPQSQVYQGVVADYKPSFSAHGVTAVLTVQGRAMLDFGAVYSRAFPREQYPRISDIVKAIFESLHCKVDVEPTKLRGKGDIIQNNMTNLKFVQDVLKPLAVSDRTGAGGYELTHDFDLITFRPPVEGEKFIYRQYLFARDRYGDVLEWSPEFNGKAILALGGGEIIAAGWDPIRRKSVQAKVTLQSSKNKRPTLAQATVHADPAGLTGRYYALPFHEDAFVQAWADSRFTSTRLGTYTGKLKIIGDPEIRPKMLVEIVVVKNDGDVHYMSGTWRITEVHHEIGMGSFTTELTVSSDGARVGEVQNFGVKKALEVKGEADEAKVPVYAVVPESVRRGKDGALRGKKGKLKGQ